MNDDWTTDSGEEDIDDEGRNPTQRQMDEDNEPTPHEGEESQEPG